MAGRNIHTLVLGSLPSRLSIERQEYYGNPQNAFWRLMGDLFGAGREIAYPERARRLVDAGIGLWDVLHSSVRPGSLDADIDLSTATANDIDGFLAKHSGVVRIGFNGKKAEQLFRRRWPQGVTDSSRQIETVSLPSTSPAHAAMGYGEKLARWSVLARAR